MFWQRVLTAAIAAPIALAIFWFGATWFVALFVGVVVLASAAEWSRLSRFTRKTHRGLFMALVAALMVIGGAAILVGVQPWLLLVPGLLFWAFAAVWLKQYPRWFAGGRIPVPAAFIVGALVLCPLYVAAIQMYLSAEAGPGWGLSGGAARIFFLLLLVWAADTGGYIAGHALGKHKLSPVISPGKTIEGAIGGLLLAAAMAAGAGWLLLDAQGEKLWQLVAVSVVVAMVSIVGDLTISMFKRQAKIKDTGSILPGHGGLLDRLDSVYAAAPVLAVGLTLIGV